MDKVEMRVYADITVDGVRRRLGFASGYRGHFLHLPPQKRKRTAMLICPVGGEQTRDYWYCHNTGSQGDVKLCRAHQVEEINDSRDDFYRSV